MPGRIVRNNSGHFAFLPNPLPGRLDINWELSSLLASADRALGRLIGVGQTLPNPKIVVDSFVRREAQLSSRIENTHADLADLALADRSPAIERAKPDVREVANNVRALNYGLHCVSSRGREIGIPLIREMHELLMRDVRGGDKHPGAFRAVQVHIGRTSRIEEARFVPAPPTHVPALMDHLADFIRQPTHLPSVVRAAMAHYQFEAIHPFADGNGRIGRVLIMLMLCADGLLPLPLLNASAYLEAHREEYYDRLLNVSRRGEWSQWVSFFARGITADAMDAVERVERITSLQRHYRAQLQSTRSSSLLTKFADHLFVQQAVTVRGTAEMLDVTPVMAQRYIDRFVRMGMLQETTGQRRNRLYLATGVLRAIEGEPNQAI